MDNSNKKKYKQLGMPIGTASGRLKKMILFNLVIRLNENFCYQCGAEIETIEEFSIEHKTAWLDNSPDLFWDLNNIAFSHLSCNVGAARSALKGTGKHPGRGRYRRGCRCDKCKEEQKLRLRAYRKKKKAENINHNVLTNNK